MFSDKLAIFNPRNWIKNRIAGTGKLRLALKYSSIGLAIIILLLILFDRVVMPLYTRHGSEFPLPNLEGKSLDDATKIAETRKFEVSVKGEQPSPDIPQGIILSQIPVPGTRIKENRQVKVIISSGVQMSEMPDLTGFSIRQAELKLPENGLKIKNYYWTETDSLANDVIAYTLPPAGSLVPMGYGVDLYINRGNRTDEGYMPKLVGKPIEEAQALLDSLGFPPANVEFVTNPMLLPKIVTYQHPAPGTKVIIDSVEILMIVPVSEND